MVRRIFHVFCVAWLAVAIVGCGGAAAEIKPTNKESQLTEEQKKKRDEEIKNSMQRNNYQGGPPKAPGS